MPSIEMRISQTKHELIVYRERKCNYTVGCTAVTYMYVHVFMVTLDNICIYVSRKINLHRKFLKYRNYDINVI